MLILCAVHTPANGCSNGAAGGCRWGVLIIWCNLTVMVWAGAVVDVVCRMLIVCQLQRGFLLIFIWQVVVQEPPEKPREVDVASVTSRSATLTWQHPYSGNSPIIRYILEFKKPKGEKQSLIPDKGYIWLTDNMFLTTLKNYALESSSTTLVVHS